MGFRTWVRFPSGPFESQASNTVQKIKIAVFKNVFSLSVDFNQFQTENDDSNSPVTFAQIQQWVKDKYGSGAKAAWDKMRNDSKGMNNYRNPWESFKDETNLITSAVFFSFARRPMAASTISLSL